MPHKKHIEGLRKDSYEDFRALYEAFADNLYGFVLGLTRSGADAGEIVQETFVKVWINRAGIDPDSSFKSYLFRIARNAAIDRFRRNAANPLFEDCIRQAENIRAEDPGAESIVDCGLFFSKVDEAKEMLSPRQREIFEMNKEKGLSPAEVAAALGISEQTVYNQLSSALRRIREHLGPRLLMMIMIFFGA